MKDFVNPYTFVGLPATVTREEVSASCGHQQYGEGLHTGWVKIEILTLTRLFIPSTAKKDRASEDLVVEKRDNQTGKKIQTKVQHTVYPKFVYDRITDRHMIPGTSLKGVIRAVMEVLSDSCLSMFAGNYKADRNDKDRRLDYSKKIPDEVRRETCQWPNLCCCCRLFGATGEGATPGEAGEEEGPTAWQGRVIFEDALVKENSLAKLDKKTWILKELSEPKPWHRAFYLNANETQIQGRKVYLHHYAGSEAFTTEKTQRNRTIQESFLPGAIFAGKVRFSNLSKEELGLLLWTLELDDLEVKPDLEEIPPGLLAHKIGMAKSLGLGSVKIRVSGLNLMDLKQRYQDSSWPAAGGAASPSQGEPETLRAQISDLKGAWSQDPYSQGPHLLHLKSFLTIPYPHKPVAYPDYQWFKSCSQTALPASGVLSADCRGPAAARPVTAAVPPGPGLKKKPEVKPASRAKPAAKTIPNKMETPITKITSKGVWVEIAEQEVLVTGISGFVSKGIQVGQKIRVGISRTGQGAIIARFKGMA